MTELAPAEPTAPPRRRSPLIRLTGGGWAIARRVFGRETSGRAFVPQVDGLRFFAIALVLLLHFADQYRVARVAAAGGPASAAGAAANAAVTASRFYAFAGVGHVGVQLFFVLSGLVLALPFARRYLADGKPVDLRAYLVRRVTRIEPPYVVNLLALYGLELARHFPRRADSVGHLLASLGYLHNVRYWQGSTVNGVAWSLEIEVQFYLLAPLLALIYRVRPAAVRRVAIGAAIVALTAAKPHLPGPHQSEPLAGMTLAHQLHYFLVGFLLADLYLLDWPRPPRWPALWDVTAVAGSAALSTVLLRFPHDRYQFAVPWLIGLIYVAAFRGRLWRWIVCRPALYLVGGMCYTIYLYHWQVGYALVGPTARWRVSANDSVDGVAHVLALAVAAVTVGSILFVLLEKPFMRRDWTTRALRLVTRRRPTAV